MFFWHLGLTSAIVYLTLGRRGIDYRVVLLGAILPDLIDKPIGRIFFATQFQNSRIFAHTLLFCVVTLLFIQLFLRGETARRWFILPVACLIHLALDAMWSQPVTLFWPLFSTHFPKDPAHNYWLEVLFKPLRHPVEGVKELIGLAVLIYMGAAYRLQDPERRRNFLRSGRLVDRGSGNPGLNGARRPPGALASYQPEPAQQQEPRDPAG
jgi:inner membrane protein